MKFRKNPVEIEAFQMTLERRWDNSEWPTWLHQAWNKEHGEGALWIDPDDTKRERLVIGTLEGVHRVEWDDCIIKGVKGELYLCKPEIFKVTYEPVADEVPGAWIIKPQILREPGIVLEFSTNKNGTPILRLWGEGLPCGNRDISFSDDGSYSGSGTNLLGVPLPSEESGATYEAAHDLVSAYSED